MSESSRGQLLFLAYFISDWDIEVNFITFEVSFIMCLKTKTTIEMFAEKKLKSKKAAKIL